MIFINNKYTKWYNSIICKAKSRNINSYTEKHHIIPVSLGGTNEPSNLVKLTPREHFICHLLLTKMTSGNDFYKMSHALHMMISAVNIGEGRYIPTGKIYEYSKRLFIESIDSIWTPEKKEKQSKKISIIMKERLSKLNSKEKFERTQKSFSSKKSWTLERRKKISKALSGRNKSQDIKKKISVKVKQIMKDLSIEEKKKKYGDHNKGKTWKLVAGKNNHILR
jgi:hypothetical protein